MADVISRATQAGCTKLMVTGSDLTESAKAVEIAKTYGEIFISCFVLTLLNQKRDVKKLPLIDQKMVCVTQQLVFIHVRQSNSMSSMAVRLLSSRN